MIEEHPKAIEYIDGIKESPRQAEVRRLAVKGLQNNEIATILGITPKTVKLHMSNVFKAWGVKSRVHLILAAHERAKDSSK